MLSVRRGTRDEADYSKEECKLKRWNGEEKKTSIKLKKSARKLNIPAPTLSNMQSEFQAKKLFFEKFQGGKKCTNACRRGGVNVVFTS